MKSTTQTLDKTSSKRSRAETTLTPTEEKVVRMRGGLRAPRDMAVGPADGLSDKMQAELLRFERRVLERAQEAAQPSTKDKILAALRESE